MARSVAGPQEYGLGTIRAAIFALRPRFIPAESVREPSEPSNWERMSIPQDARGVGVCGAPGREKVGRERVPVSRRPRQKNKEHLPGCSLETEATMVQLDDAHINDAHSSALA